MWTRCPDIPPWPAAETHVWRTTLRMPPEQVAAFAVTLSADERERADKYLSSHRRAAFVVGRGVLRNILGRYLRIKPQDVRFAYTEFDKPELAAPQDNRSLRFNVSHSGDLALYAVAAGRQVGVDVEYLREGSLEDRMRIAARFFSPREYEALNRLPVSQRQTAFFTCWTRKEAFVKARGDGFSLPLHRFDVSVSPDEPAALVHTEWDPAEATRWSLVSIDPGEGYAAAVAVEGKTGQHRLWDWTGE